MSATYREWASFPQKSHGLIQAFDATLSKKVRRTVSYFSQMDTKSGLYSTGIRFMFRVSCDTDDEQGMVFLLSDRGKKIDPRVVFIENGKILEEIPKAEMSVDFFLTQENILRWIDNPFVPDLKEFFVSGDIVRESDAEDKFTFPHKCRVWAANDLHARELATPGGYCFTKFPLISHVFVGMS